MKVKYVGIFDAVFVPALSAEAVPHGEVLEVAEDIGAELIMQSGVWETVAEAPSRPVRETKSTQTQPVPADEEV